MFTFSLELVKREMGPNRFLSQNVKGIANEMGNVSLTETSVSKDLKFLIKRNDKNVFTPGV